MRPQATFSFFIFLQLFHFFTLLVAPSSSSLLPPRPSFLLVPPSSLFLFLPRPALSQSLRFHKRPIFIEFDESVTDRPTDGRTNRRTDKAYYRDARTHLKRRENDQEREMAPMDRSDHQFDLWSAKSDLWIYKKSKKRREKSPSIRMTLKNGSLT